MKKLFFLTIFGLMSFGVFASTPKIDTELSVKTTEYHTESITIKEASITVNCQDGSSWTVTCDGCSTQQLINIAMALCD